MMSLSSSIMKAMGVRRAYMDTATESHHENSEKVDKKSLEYKKSHLSADKLARTPDNRERYSPIPAIPADIGYHSSASTGGSHPSGVMSNVAGNPAVILGLGLTTMALLGMIRKSALGDKLGTQKMMQYRIMAQFFTVTALVAGVTLFGGMYEGGEKPTESHQPSAH